MLPFESVISQAASPQPPHHRVTFISPPGTAPIFTQPTAPGGRNVHAMHRHPTLQQQQQHHQPSLMMSSIPPPQQQYYNHSAPLASSQPLQPMTTTTGMIEVLTSTSSPPSSLQQQQTWPHHQPSSALTHQQMMTLNRLHASVAAGGMGPTTTTRPAAFSFCNNNGIITLFDSAAALSAAAATPTVSQQQQVILSPTSFGPPSTLVSQQQQSSGGPPLQLHHHPHHGHDCSGTITNNNHPPSFMLLAPDTATAPSMMTLNYGAASSTSSTTASDWARSPMAATHAQLLPPTVQTTHCYEVAPGATVYAITLPNQQAHVTPSMVSIGGDNNNNNGSGAAPSLTTHSTMLATAANININNNCHAAPSPIAYQSPPQHQQSTTPQPPLHHLRDAAPLSFAAAGYYTAEYAQTGTHSAPPSSLRPAGDEPTNVHFAAPAALHHQESSIQQQPGGVIFQAATTASNGVAQQYGSAIATNGGLFSRTQSSHDLQRGVETDKSGGGLMYVTPYFPQQHQQQPQQHASPLGSRSEFRSTCATPTASLGVLTPPLGSSRSLLTSTTYSRSLPLAPDAAAAPAVYFVTSLSSLDGGPPEMWPSSSMQTQRTSGVDSASYVNSAATCPDIAPMNVTVGSPGHRSFSSAVDIVSDDEAMTATTSRPPRKQQRSMKLSSSGSHPTSEAGDDDRSLHTTNGTAAGPGGDATAATANRNGSDGNFSARTLVNALRRAATDETAASMFARFESAKAEAVAEEVSSKPPLIVELCRVHRGRVVSSVLERYGPDRYPALLTAIGAQFCALAQHIGGCVALTRIIALLTARGHAAAVDRLFQRCLPFVGELTSHPYGNFVVSHFVTCGNRSYLTQITQRLSEAPHVALAALCNKHGAFVIDAIFGHCTHISDVFALIQAIVAAAAEGLLESRPWLRQGNASAAPPLLFPPPPARAPEKPLVDALTGVRAALTVMDRFAAQISLPTAINNVVVDPTDATAATIMIMQTTTRWLTDTRALFAAALQTPEGGAVPCVRVAPI